MDKKTKSKVITYYTIAKERYEKRMRDREREIKIMLDEISSFPKSKKD